MPKVILQVYPTLGAAGGDGARCARSAATTRPTRTCSTGLVELAKAADDLGYWGLAHTEHHLHTEGMEISPSPLMLNIHLGAHTQRIMHGQLGLVLPAHDPIRLAEEIAMADHLLRGRLFVGMARGYQSRWMNILCQKLGVGATYSDGSEADASNRLLFSENFKIMKQAWAQDLLTYDGPTYKVPNPLEGIPDWPPAQTITSKYGAPGEIGEDGTTVKGVSVVPKPYTSPHPPLFQAFGASPPTIEWCGENDVVPTILFGARRAHPRAAGDLPGGPRLRRARDRAGRARRRLPDVPHRRGRAGRGRGARRAAAPRGPLGGARVARLVRDVRPARPHAAAARRGRPGPRARESIGERLIRSGVMIGGTVDMVKRQIEEFLQVLPVDYLVWLFHWGLIPRDEGLRRAGALRHGGHARIRDRRAAPRLG